MNTLNVRHRGRVTLRRRRDAVADMAGGQTAPGGAGQKRMKVEHRLLFREEGVDRGEAEGASGSHAAPGTAGARAAYTAGGAATWGCSTASAHG